MLLAKRQLDRGWSLLEIEMRNSGLVHVGV